MEQLKKDIVLTRIIIDFEMAELNGYKEALKNTFGPSCPIKISGCLFHYGQALYRYFMKWHGKGPNKHKELQVLYVYLWLPYLGREKCNDIMARMEKKDICGKLTHHVGHYWLEQRGDWWGASEFADVAILTNCAIESFHARLNSRIKGDHPSLFDLQEILFSIDMYKFHCYDLAGQKKTHDDTDSMTAVTRGQIFKNNALSIEDLINTFIRELPDRQETIGVASAGKVAVEGRGKKERTKINECLYNYNHVYIASAMMCCEAKEFCLIDERGKPKQFFPGLFQAFSGKHNLLLDN
jgi:hypothetical protein